MVHGSGITVNVNRTLMMHTCVVETQIIVYFSNGATMPPRYMVYLLSIILYVLSSHFVHLGNKLAVLDDSLFPDFLTICHKQCEMLLSGNAVGHPVRCSVCSSYRSTLLTQTRCMTNGAESNHVNYR